MIFSPLARLCRSVGRLAGRLRADERGNILMMMGFATIPLVFAIGFGIDYSRAERMQTQIDAAADAAALAAVTEPMMQNTTTAAQTAAQDMFSTQTANLPGVSNISVSVSVSSTGSLNNGRSAIVQWTASSTNYFGGILGKPSLPIGGTSKATAAGAPYINFYLMLDNSPSMLLPSTSAGLSAIRTATSYSSNPTLPSGCDFACHEQHPHNDSVYVRNSNGYDVLLSTGYYTSTSPNYHTYYFYNESNGQLYNAAGTALNGSSTSTSGNTTTTVTNSYTITDSTSGPVTINLATTTAATTTTTNRYGQTSSNTTTNTANSTYDTGYWADGYWLTQNYSTLNGGSSIDLRIDDEVAAAQQLIPYATNMATTNNVTYNMQMFAFNWSGTHPGTLNTTATQTTTTSPVTQLTSSMVNVNTLSASSVPNLVANQDWWYSNNNPTSSYGNNDEGTEFHNMLTYMYNLMPAPGDGSSASSPQEVLFIVTDGMSDEVVGGSRTHSPLNSTLLADCASIKNHYNPKIKIAILYTVYLPDALTGDSWSQSNVYPYLSPTDQDSTALQSCASTGSDGVTPLFYTVTTDQSIANALQALFALTVQNAHLVT